MTKAKKETAQFDALQAKREVITAAMIEKLDTKLASESMTTANRKKLDGYKRFFEYNQDALNLIAQDDGDTVYIADQIYAIDKLIDLLAVATSGHVNHKFKSSMHVFALRTLLTLRNLKNANAPIDITHTIWCCLNGEIKPKHDANLYHRGKIGYSSEKTQGVQVLNVLRTLRIIDEKETDLTKRVNLETSIAQKIFAALDASDLAFLKA
jgi:hypothetical protein